ncbi:MAG TPA: hypothetical protein VNT79_14735 [Phycisphaerae bacterium]|nr:hypothetical protein [Phycisphaerae bacterium]
MPGREQSNRRIGVHFTAEEIDPHAAAARSVVLSDQHDRPAAIEDHRNALRSLRAIDDAHTQLAIQLAPPHLEEPLRAKIRDDVNRLENVPERAGSDGEIAVIGGGDDASAW